MTRTPKVSPDLHQELDAIWSTGPGLATLSAVNHTVVGRRFVVTAFGFLVFGGLLAMLIRAQLATPHSAFMSPELYNQVFTMHGTVMMFLFVIPALEGVAMYLLPKMLGARDLAFPRLSAYGYWCYLFGGLLLVGGFFAGVAPDAGWFMYPPLSAHRYTPGISADFWLIGVTFVEISAVSAAVEIAVSVLKVRAPGMSLDRLPIFAWAMLITAFMILFAFPPLILASVMLELERAFGWPFFDPDRGGDPLLWQHLFWFFGHPEVYIIFLPAAGLVSTLLPVVADRPLVGYRWLVAAAAALAVISFTVWVHHMFAAGVHHLAVDFFSAASLLVVIPTGILVFGWIATLMAGRPRHSLPMLYLFGFFFIFVAGGLTGVMVAVVPFDWQVHDTHFVVAHFHYVLIGGQIFPLLAAAYYYLPLVTGRHPVYRLGTAAFWLIFLGFNMTFLVMHWTGLLGMPRRVALYADGLGWEWPNLVSSVGGFLSAMGFGLFLLDVLLQFRFGRIVRRKRGAVESLEWSLPMPPPSYSFASLPRIESRHPFQDDPALPDRLAAGEGYLGFVRHGWLETLGVAVRSGEAEQSVRLPGPSHLPLATALATGLFFLGVLFKTYWLAGAGVLATFVLVLLWSRGTGLRRDTGLLPAGNGLELPPHVEAARPPAWWGLVFLLAADFFAFASLLYAGAYLPFVAPGWPPPRQAEPEAWLALAAAVALIAAVVASRAALRTRSRHLSLGVAALAQAGAAGLLLVQFAGLPSPSAHAYGATLAVLTLYAVVHSTLGAVFAVYCIHRVHAGYVSDRRLLDLRLAALWQAYTGVTGLAVLSTVGILAPALAG